MSFVLNILVKRFESFKQLFQKAKKIYSTSQSLVAVWTFRLTSTSFLSGAPDYLEDTTNIILTPFSRTLLKVMVPRFFLLIYGPCAKKAKERNPVRNFQHGTQTRLV